MCFGASGLLSPCFFHPRFQRSRQGDFHVGDTLPPGAVQLLELVAGAEEGAEPPPARSVDLADLARGARPLVLLAGSWS